MHIKFSTILPMLGQARDRFCVYNAPRTLAQRLETAAQVEGMRGVEMIYPFELEDMAEARRLLGRYGLECSTVNVNLKSDSQFHRGSLTSVDSATRAEAVRYLQRGMDIAGELGCGMITVCPLADGSDYPFEMDYVRAWRWLREGVAQAASYRPDIKLSLEYKANETRGHCLLSTAGVSLHLCQQIGLPNVGVTMDLGHALYAGEAPALATAMLAEAGRLFLVHVNDNYRDADWDMLPGSANFWDLLETMLYLDALGYDGWITSDVTSARLDPLAVARLTLKTLQTCEKLLDKLGREKLWTLIRQDDFVTAFAYIQDQLLR